MTRKQTSMAKAPFWVIVLLLLGYSVPAEAVEVYFNGVRVTGIKNQSFDHCTVRFDGTGNVHVTAKGYTVKQLPQNARSPKPSGKKADRIPKTSRKYFLYSRASRPGYAQYDIDVYINGKWIQKVRSTKGQVILEITKKLRPGKNVIHFAATKNYRGKGRLSTSSKDHVEVFVGLGTKGGGTVNITSTLTSFKAAASSTKNFGQEQTIQVD